VSWVVDASVAVKWVVEEAGRDAARNLLLKNDKLIAPEFLLIETANVLRSKVSRGHFDRDQTHGSLQTVRAAIDLFVPDSELADSAFGLSLELDHTVYDCVYLACAQRHDVRMITADRKLVGKLQRIGGWERVEALPS
jgi:predicted nucleic acid-binding protein